MRQPALFTRSLLASTCALGILLLAGCNSKPITVDAPPPEVTKHTVAPTQGVPAALQNLVGTYQAVLPCHNCPGIAIIVQLRADQTATVRERRFGGNTQAAPTTTYTGAYRFDPPGGSMISLGHGKQSATSYRFLVGEDWIEMRDRNNSAPLGTQPTYRLKKTSTSKL